MPLRNWLMGEPSEREKWAAKLPLVRPEHHLGLSALDPISARLYGEALPRGVRVAKPTGDRPPVNAWMPPAEVAAMSYRPGHIVLGKIAGVPIGFQDDRPIVTVARARAGKTSTVLEPNLLLYPGSILVLDPKAELARATASVRIALGHNVHVLDPFGQSGFASSSFNLMSELDPDSDTIIDDVAGIAQAIVPEEGEHRSKHWTDSARMLLTGVILFTLTLPPAERNLVTVRQLLALTHPALREALRAVSPADDGEAARDEFFIQNRAAVEMLTRAMATQGDRFAGILADIGRRFTETPPNERGSIFSTAAAHTDFLDSIPLRRISRSSDFGLKDLRSDRPMTIYLVLPVGRMERHYRWLRMIVQQACTTLEKLGPYPRGRTPILFMMEEFATLGHLEIMERAAAYFPGFGVKLWAVLQDLTQLRRYYQNSFETFLGNAGVIQAFSTGDPTTLDFIADYLARLMVPFELRAAFARDMHTQLLLIEGKAPIAAARLEHSDVDTIRAAVLARAGAD